MAVELKEVNGSLQVVSTRPLWEMFQTMYLTAAGVNQYDINRDGTRIVADSVMTDESSTPLSLVVNWTTGLRK